MRAAAPLPERETLALPGGDAVVTWRRSARARRVSLRIDAIAGAVIVTLPLRAGRRAGMALLMTNAAWVSSRLAALPPAVGFADGVVVAIEGEEFRISHRPGQRLAARLLEGRLEVGGEAAFLPRRVADFLRGEARRRLSARAMEKAALAGVSARRVSVKDTRSRWGSCSADRSLAFSWRLVLAPGFVQDYVAAHEVAHLRHMNHGAQFWATVAELTPHTEAAVCWLKLHGARLLRVG